MNNVDKFYWVMNHEGIGAKGVQGTIELTPHLVNPENDTIEEDESLNTKQQWWVEFSKIDQRGEDMPTHYWELDCGGDTAEEAVNALYTKVLSLYGEY